MGDNEKLENLANARRKLKKFRDQQSTSPLNSNTDTFSTNGTSTNSIINSNPISPNGFHSSPSKSPILSSKAPFRLGEQNRGSNTSSRISDDLEQKLRRDIEHLQEQLEIHVQTIGILVAEKTDISAKLTQSFKQLERKQSEMDELYGRLKASRERVQELEKDILNSTSNVQKREMAAKESDKENDRLKIENIRQSQLIEDLKQTINQLNDKLHHRQTTIDHLTTELDQLKKSHSEPTQIDELIASTHRLRSDNDQYQQYHNDMQQHIQQLNHQIHQLNESNQQYQIELQTMKTIPEDQQSINSTQIHSEEMINENRQLKIRIEELEHTIMQLQSETETIGDYIHLYQQQREQLQKRYQEKDEIIQQLTEERDQLQRQISNGRLKALNEMSDEKQRRILTLIEELGEKNISMDNSSTIQLAFVDHQNVFLCSTCSGSVKSV